MAPGVQSEEKGTGAAAPVLWRGRLRSLKQRLQILKGWRRTGVLGGLGILAALALPPLYLLPLLVPAFTGLLWRVEGEKSAPQAFVSGWWFGFGHAAAGL